MSPSGLVILILQKKVAKRVKKGSKKVLTKGKNGDSINKLLREHRTLKTIQNKEAQSTRQ